jgi:hypothetical protein
MGGNEPVNVGIDSSVHGDLKRLKEDGHFSEMVDAYRFAIAMALAHGGQTADIVDRQNLFNVGSLDSDRTLYSAIAVLRIDYDEPVYRTAERLATWGVTELQRRREAGTLSFAEILQEAEALTNGDEPQVD